MHKESGLDEDRIEIYYQEMNAMIQKVVDCIEEEIYIQGAWEGEKYSIPIQDIYYFDTVDKLSFVYLKNRVYKVPYTLGKVEERLKNQGFVRISKSVIVNIYKVKCITSELNMRIKVQLENNEALLVSRHYKKCFEQALQSIHKQLKEENL